MIGIRIRYARGIKMRVQNPIIRGFYPDPSVCKVNDKYYLACSSFQYFPAVPLFESEDLVNWRQIGHCLTRKSQVKLHRVPSSGGVFAPTLRYHDGFFYMVTNNNTYSKNFYIVTNDIYGEWSEPIFVDQQGIDPSLLFDEKNVYFTSNGNDVDGTPCILQCTIDIKTGRKLTKTVPIWQGSGGRYLESPHLYHIGDWYYLMVAEGGTEYGHMITYARARQPFGPYEDYQKNPVLTNRNLGGNQSLIQGIGHGELVKGPDEKYYMVCLGFRQSDIWQPYHHLGREVFVTQVYWQEDDWFTAGTDGVVCEWENLHIAGEQQVKSSYDLTLDVPLSNNPRWTYLRDYKEENYRLEKEKLYLRGTTITLDEPDSPTFIGVRQSEFFTHLYVEILGEAAEAGVTFYMDEYHHYDLFCTQESGKKWVLLRLRIGDAQQTIAKIELDWKKAACLEVFSTQEMYQFYMVDKEEVHCLGRARTKYLSSEVAGGFTGVFMGLYVVDSVDRWSCFSKLKWTQRSEIISSPYDIT